MRSPAVVVVDGNRIQAVNPAELPADSTEIDLGDVTLLPGLMDMELNLLIGGPGGPDGLPNPMHGVQDDPVYRTLRGAVNARTTLEAGFTTVRNLGLMVKTGGYLLDVALQRAIEQGWHVGPRIYPAGHAVTPYGGHLDPTVFQRLAPGIMPLSVAEGIANGVDDVRACVRYQIRHGAKLIKVSASGGVMSHSTAPGAQQYSDEEFAAIADEAHRAGVRVAAHAVGDSAIRACIRAGIDCIEHGFLATDETIQMMVDHGTFLVSTTYLTEAMAIDRIAPELRKKAEEVFPRAQAMLPKAIAAGVRIACGTDAPAIPHGQNAKELVRAGRPGHDADAGAASRHDHQRGADRGRRRARPARARIPRRHHRRPRRSVARHRHHARCAVRDEGRRGLQAMISRLAERSAVDMEQTDNILWLLKQAWYFSLTTVNDAVSEHGVSTAQIGMLRQLATEPGLSGADLARRLLISPQGVQLALKELERRGLVERKQDPQHGRILQAFLTDQGRKVAEAVVSDAIAAHAKVFGVLSSDEQETLRDLLGRVIEQGTGHKLHTDHIGPE